MYALLAWDGRDKGSEAGEVIFLKKIDNSLYKEYIEAAGNCTANQIYPMSIATGVQKGEIYTDGKDGVLFWHYCGFAYISGVITPGFLEEIYLEFLISDKNRRFLLITDSEYVSDHYSGRELLRLDKRIEYAHSGMPGEMPVLDEGFVVEEITAENIGDIKGRIIPSFSWEICDSFLKNGFGFMAESKEDGNFAAVAFSSAVSPEEVDIGVETAEEYRHRGLASCLAYEMCKKIIQQGKKPVWAHAEINKGSQKTALSVGFEQCRINTVIHKNI